MTDDIHENDQFEGRPAGWAEAMQAKQQIEENIFWTAESPDRPAAKNASNIDREKR